jgi:DNA repair protein RadC
MKNLFRLSKKFTIALILAVFFISAQSLAAQSPVPNLIKTASTLPDFMTSPPQRADTIFGIGDAKYTSIPLSQLVAESRARRSIIEQLVIESSDLVDVIIALARDAESEEITEIVNLSLQAYSAMLDEFILNNAIAIERRVQTTDGTIWYLVSISRANTRKIIADVKATLEG